MTEHHSPYATNTPTSAVMSLTAAQIPCCICGTMIYPNAANQCTTCLSQDFNLQDYIQRPASSVTGNIRNSNDESSKIVIFQCRNCRRFQRTEKCWEVADHESSQLMSICLKHIPALQHNYHSSSHSSSQSSSSSAAITSSSSSASAIGPLRLMDAQWIWTEPHCMRYKIRCTIQTEIHNVRVQQRVQVLIHCVFKMCTDCTREFNHRTWQSVVQLRQKVSAEQQLSSSSSSSNVNHNGTIKASSLSSKNNNNNNANGLMILEQTLAKNKEIRKHVLKIDQVPHNGGFDFYFVSIPHAHTFVSFLQRIIPMRVRTSKKLVSTDAHSKNMANMKHTMVCDMVPFNVHDLICIHKSTSKSKFAGHLVLVTKLASVIHLINAAPQPQLLLSNVTTTGSNKKSSNGTTNNSMIDDCIMELSAETYYKQEKQYRVLQASHRLVRFVVLDVELIDTNHTDNVVVGTTSSSNAVGTKQHQQQYEMAEVLVARESDMGTNDHTFSTITHLGCQIEAGDIVLGYDLTSSSIYLDDDDVRDTFYNNFTMPEIVLVKKAPPVTTTGEYQSNATTKSNKKPIKEKRQQRRRPNDGKRVRELEVRAKRMGFIEEENVNEVVDDEEIVNNDDDDAQDVTDQRPNNYMDDDSMLYDTDIMNEVLALEREFETLDTQQPDRIDAGVMTNDNDDDTAPRTSSTM